MKKVFLIGFLLSSTLVFSQGGLDSTGRPKADPEENDEKFWRWDKVVFGGGLGLSFGTFTSVDFSPLVGYKVTEKIMLGVGGTYLFYKYQPTNFSTNVYGGRVFGRYKVSENIFAHAEYEILNLERYDFLGGRENIENTYVGGGLRQPIGERSSYFILALWNLTPSNYFPQNPVIRMGFNVGF